MNGLRLMGGNLAILIAHGVLSLVPRSSPPTTDAVPALPGGDGDNDSLVIGPSLIPGAGLGCFADREYAEGEVVCTYPGEVLTTFQMLRTRNLEYMMGLGPDSAGRRLWVDLRPYLRVRSRYINHHIDPDRRNLEIIQQPDERRVLLVAQRAIGQGEELYYDYGPRHWHCFERRPDILRQERDLQRSRHAQQAIRNRDG